MSGSEGMAKEALAEGQEKPATTNSKEKGGCAKKPKKRTGVAREKIKKAG